jgi:LysR family hydrogen peroxide-inducible transcriptional activator
VELSQLRYFLKVAERGNFTRAGEDLGVTQPALSRSIARLESEIGQPVFDRQSKSVVLTDAGRLLHARAEQILSLVSDTLAELTDDGKTGRVRVGAIPTVAPYLLPGILRDFRTRCPRAQVVALEETTDKLLHRLRQGEIDVALLAAPVTEPHLDSVSLFEEELLLVLPAGHALAKRERVTLSELREHPFVLLDETHCLTGAVVSFCERRSFQPVSVEHTSQLATVEELVSLGHGISLIPQMARRHDRDPRRVYRSISHPRPTRTIVLVWNPYRFQSKLTNRFKECVRQVAKSGGS